MRASQPIQTVRRRSRLRAVWAEKGELLDGRYRVRREIASTAMGSVVEAEQRHTLRVVAIKRLDLRIARDPANRERFLREVRFLSAARCPHFVEVLDAGEWPPDVPYMVMEMLDGRSLDGVLAARPQLPIAEAVRVVRDACIAVAAAHEQGVVHRDVKPSNLFLARPGSSAPPVKLIDFGIAMTAATAPGRPKLTRTGELLGTAEYMAPEQLMNEPLDARCDLYALGVTLFEALTGEVPFSGSFPEVLVKHTTSPAAPSPRLARPDVPVELEGVVARALARRRDDRFPDARSFCDALAALLERLEVPAAGGPTAVQRRRFSRVPYVTPVRIVRDAKPPLDGRSDDLSEGGMLVIGPDSLGREEQVRVRFASPIDGVIVVLSATARWIVAARGGRGAIGLEFCEVPDETRRVIARYVELMGGDSAPWDLQSGAS